MLKSELKNDMTEDHNKVLQLIVIKFFLKTIKLFFNIILLIYLLGMFFIAYINILQDRVYNNDSKIENFIDNFGFNNLSP